jgi:foldase protein PrsA
MTSRSNGKKLSGKARLSAKIAIVIMIVSGLTLSLLPAGCSDGAENAGGGAVIATVNGEEIYEEEFILALEEEKAQFQMQGIDLESAGMEETLKEVEQQVLDNYFIIPLLVLQEAGKAGISISDAQIEARYQEYIAAFGDEEALLAQMEASGITREDLDNEIVRELTIQEYLEYYIDDYLENNPGERIVEEEIEIPRAEVEEYYEYLLNDYNELKALLEEDDPELPMEQIEMYFAQIEAHYGDLLENGDREEILDLLEQEMQEHQAAELREIKVQRIIEEHILNLQEVSEIEKFI